MTLPRLPGENEDPFRAVAQICYRALRDCEHLVFGAKPLSYTGGPGSDSDYQPAGLSVGSARHSVVDVSPLHGERFDACSAPAPDALEWPGRTGRAAVVEIDWQALSRAFEPQNLCNYLLSLRSSKMYQIGG